MIIKNKVALITGSSHRVGRAIATTLAERGAKVVIHYQTSKSEAENTAKSIRARGGTAMVAQADIRKRDDWLKMRTEVLDQWQNIDILINNAAIFYKTFFPEISDQQWDEFFDINLKGTFLGCQIIGGYMYKQKAGKIVNIADVSADTIWPNYLPYCISKSGVIALTKGLAKVFAPNITVNAVSPGTVLLAENYNAEEEKSLIQKTPLKRVGHPKDIANTVLFLLEGSDFITGEIIKVDGGRSIA